MMNQFRGGSLVVMGALSLLAACDNAVDDSENGLVSNEQWVAEQEAENEGGVSSEEGDPPEPGACDACELTGQWFRVDIIELQTVDNNPEHPAVISLNSEWKGDIERGELNIFLHAIEATAETVQYEVRTGARIDGTTGDVCLLDIGSASLPATRDSCTFVGTEPTALSIYGGSPAFPKICAPDIPVPNAIPLDEVQLQGVLSADDCATFTADAVGVVPESALFNSCSCLFKQEGEFSDECGAQQPGAQPQDNSCTGCGNNFEFANLHAALTLLAPGGDLAKCTTSSGEAAVCIEAQLRGIAIEPPPNCAQ